MMIDKIEFENQQEEEKSRYVDELYQTLSELEQEYQWTQAPQTKLEMLNIAREINDIIKNY